MGTRKASPAPAGSFKSPYRSCYLEFGDEPKARLGRETKLAGFGLRTRS